MASADLRTVPLSPAEGFRLDADRVVDAMSDETAAVILNTPCNPTGRVFDQDAVRAVVDAAVERDAYVVADEVYEGLVYEGSREGIASYTDAPERVLSVNSCSKAYAMTGWRLGWLAGPQAVVDAARRLHQGTTSCASSVSQHAALAALTGPQEPIHEMKTTYEERRAYVVDRVASLSGVTCPEPQGGFYAFLDVRRFGDSSLDLAKRLVNDYGVVTAPGIAFGEAGEGFLRVSYSAALDELERGFDRIESMVEDAR
jgi:aspartate aminotransferase